MKTWGPLKDGRTDGRGIIKLAAGPNGSPPSLALSSILPSVLRLSETTPSAVVVVVVSLRFVAKEGEEEDGKERERERREREDPVAIFKTFLRE